MKDLYNLIDQQLLSLLTTWDRIHEDLMDAAMHLPDGWIEFEESGDLTQDMVRYDADSEMLTGLEIAARQLISSAEDAHLITNDDWRVMNAIICSIGLDDPDTAAILWWRGAEEDDGNPPLCCSPAFPREVL